MRPARRGPGAAPSRAAGASSHEAGSSLIEVLISLIVLSITLFGVMHVMVHVSQQRSSSEELAYAFAACRDNLEQLRALPIDTVATMNGTPFDVPGPNSAPGFLSAMPDDADGLPGNIEITVERKTPWTVLYRVAVTVEWRGRRGDRTLRLEQLMGER